MGFIGTFSSGIRTTIIIYVIVWEIFLQVLLFRMYPLMICVFSLVLVLNVPISFASYDFFMLSQTWPATYCGIKNRLLPCAKQPNTFTIHGLWPQNHIGPQPASCSNLQKDKFDKRIVSLSYTLKFTLPSHYNYCSMLFYTEV